MGFSPEVEAALRKQIATVAPDIDDSQIEYMASICNDLIQEGCFDVEEWVAGIGPILDDWVDDDNAAARICDGVIAELQGGKEVPPAAAPSAEVTHSREEGDQPVADGPVLVHMEDMHLGFMNGRMLLQKTMLHLEKGRRYGLVGQNGAGKTTLMRRIAQKDMPGFPQHLNVIYVEHEIAGDSVKKSVVAFIVAVAEQLGLEGDVEGRVREILSSVGFEQTMQDGPLEELSGGWRMRLAIAKALLSKADILLLDEPTNHLDVHAVGWLENFLSSLAEVCVVVVSHEPTFLDAVCTDTILIRDSKLDFFEGNFTSFTSQQENFTLADLRLSEGTALAFKFPMPEKLTGVAATRCVLRMANVNFSYGAGRPNVLSGINCSLMLQSRCAVIGENGAGKSTLVKLLVGELAPNDGVDGKVWRHHNLRVAYVAQHSMFHLENHVQETATHYIQQRYPTFTQTQTPKLLSFFSPDVVRLRPRPLLPTLPTTHATTLSFARGFDRESTVIKRGQEVANSARKEPPSVYANIRAARVHKY